MSGIGVIAGVQDDASCAWKPIHPLFFLFCIFFFMEEYTIIILLLPCQGVKTKLPALWRFAGLFHS
jgi:hypothetical protein